MHINASLSPLETWNHLRERDLYNRPSRTTDTLDEFHDFFGLTSGLNIGCLFKSLASRDDESMFMYAKYV